MVTLSSEQVVAAQKAAVDGSQVSSRHKLARYAAQTFSVAGEELYAVGHIFGSDRVSGESPHGHGNDEIVAVSLLLRIAGQLIAASESLFRDGHTYAAAALIRQMVEIEYLAWAFHTRDKDAERWLRSDAEVRRQFFTPAKLRAAAQGKFRGQDYGYHCELGGHPVPGAEILFRSEPFTAQLLLSDLLGHAGRIWDHLLGWSAGTEWAVPIHKRREEMYENFSAWKKADTLTSLPPPP